MEPFFADPNIERLPPEKIRFVDLRAEPNTDGDRFKVTLELIPFLKRPYIELSLKDPNGVEVTSASIIEPMGWKLELTLHIRKASAPIPPSEAGGKIIEETRTKPYVLTAVLSYPDLGEVDRHSFQIEGRPTKNDLS